MTGETNLTGSLNTNSIISGDITSTMTGSLIIVKNYDPIIDESNYKNIIELEVGIMILLLFFKFIARIQRKKWAKKTYFIF